MISIYAAITGKSNEEIVKESEGKGYGDFKTQVAECVIEELRPMQEKYKELIQNPEYLKEIYRKGQERAKVIAENTLKDVYKKIGLI